MKHLKLLFNIVFMFFMVVPSAKATDPLPSWNNGDAKNAIIDFVTRTTTEDSADYVRPAERIAVFDNDGTLWTEQPVYSQMFFILDQTKTLADSHPEWTTTEPFASAIKGDLKAVASQGKSALDKLLMETHAGLTQEEYTERVQKWLETARHPVRKTHYSETVYQPMIELLGYLRAHGFKTYIVTGGGVDFVRAFSEKFYGIPPEQVIGSSLKTRWVDTKTGFAVVKQPEPGFVDDKEGKPIAINLHIGRRPIMAFGNSDGDLQMLQWTMAGKGPRFALIVHHTDEIREVAYDRQSEIGTLDKALDEAIRGKWVIVDMKKDWRTVFPASIGN